MSRDCLECKNFPCCADYKGNYEEVRNYFSIENVPFEIIPGIKSNSRTRSKLAVRGTNEKPLIGLFYPGTHEVFEIPYCMIQHERINQAINLIKKWIIAQSIAPYQEKGHKGLLRYIQCIVERKTSTVQISLVLNSRYKPEGIDLAIQHLAEMCPPHFLHSIWINYNPSRLNVIFSSDWEHCVGKKWIEEEIASIPVCYLPGSFGQANLNSFERLINSIKKSVPIQKKVGEFYAGVGVIGLGLASQSHSVILCESNPDSKVCFDEMKFHLPESVSSKVSYRLAKTEQSLDLLKNIEIAIVDPPRKGLDWSFISRISRSKVEQLVYVSCGWPSLIRDLKILKIEGWELEKAEGYPFFPGTPHIEILAILKKLC